MDLRQIFDEDAELYDRVRPGYPDAVFDDLLELAAAGAGPRVLEIGPGTGQATVLLAGRGCQVLAVELGASLAATLRRKVNDLPVQVIAGAFEDSELPTGAFDLVASFTAWHWLTPEVRARKAHAVLRPGGSLATVTTTHVLGGSEQFFAEAQSCYERWDDDTPPGLRLESSEEIAAPTDEVDRSPLFEPAARRVYHQDIAYSTSGYLDLLNSYSGHRAMPPDRRAGLLTCLGNLIDSRYQGSITKRYRYDLRVARRR
ncbi:MAG: class I SAM-dependent methyltransferase [Friedmanniella sp.]